MFVGKLLKGWKFTIDVQPDLYDLAEEKLISLWVS